jgi:hypothetical protein
LAQTHLHAFYNVGQGHPPAYPFTGDSADRAASSAGFVVQPRHRVIERSLGWFRRWRRLSKY